VRRSLPAVPQVVVAKCSDPQRDGGYWSTSRMLLEAGLCLALDGERLKQARGVAPLQAGVLGRPPAADQRGWLGWLVWG
jgi:hypothetical protein